MITGGLIAKPFYVLVGRFGLKQRVVNQARPIARRSCVAQHQSDSRRPGIHHAMHSLRAPVEALAGAAAHRGLLFHISVKTRYDDVRNLLDKSLEIPVISVGHPPIQLLKIRTSKTSNKNQSASHCGIQSRCIRNLVLEPCGRH
jgi:hypothetical protein